MIYQPVVARMTCTLHTNSALLGCRPYTIVLIRFLKFNFILLAFSAGYVLGRAESVISIDSQQEKKQKSRRECYTVRCVRYQN